MCDCVGGMGGAPVDSRSGLGGTVMPQPGTWEEEQALGRILSSAQLPQGPAKFPIPKGRSPGLGAGAGCCQQKRQKFELHLGGAMKEGEGLVESHTARQWERFLPRVQGSFHSIKASGPPEGSRLPGGFSRSTQTQKSHSGPHLD